MKQTFRRSYAATVVCLFLAELIAALQQWRVRSKNNLAAWGISVLHWGC